MKCLVVDDNEEITHAILTFFETKNHSCRVINDGKDALEVIKNEDFDLILLDLAMPVFSGYDIIDELEASNMLRPKNIVVITASQPNEPKHKKILEQGIKDILFKPISLERLKELVNTFNSQ